MNYNRLYGDIFYMVYLKIDSVVSKILSVDHKELHWDTETK